jgi:hypothetical protein
MIVIPKLSELYDSIIADLEAVYGEPIPVFGKNFLRAVAAVQAAKLNIYYRAIALTQKNIWVDTADSEFYGGTLERFGRTKLNRDPFPAQAGQYDVTVTGTIGATIPASTTFKSDDTSLNPGKLYILDAAYVLISASDNINLRALESGLDSKLLVSDKLTATSPIINVNKSATVTAETVQPLSAETIEDYRQKVLDAYVLESQGGAAGDYILWSFDAQGVAAVYPYAKTGAANEADVFIEATIADSTDGKGTPGALILADVEAVIELDPDTSKTLYERGRRPLTVFAVNVLPVTIKNIEIEVIGFVGITAAIQTTIFNALKDELSRIRPFIAGADVLANKNDILDVNVIIGTILKARPGSIFSSVVLKVDAVPVSSYTFINGNIPYLDTVTYL